MYDVEKDLKSLLYYYVCSVNSSEAKLLDDVTRSGLKVNVFVHSLDDNKYSVNTRLAYTYPMQARSCECQSKINDILCTNLYEILSKSIDVKLRREKIKNLHNITQTYDKSTSHFIDCSGKSIPQSTNSLSPMNDNVFSPVNRPSPESLMTFFPHQNQRTSSYQRTSRSKDSFFIKSQRISYDNSDNETPIISIKTVVTKKDYTCEMVFKTIAIKMSDGKMETFQRSFVRSYLKCQHKDEFVSIDESKELNNKIIEPKQNALPIKKTISRQHSLKLKTKKLSFNKRKQSPKISDPKHLKESTSETSLPNEKVSEPTTNISVVVEPIRTKNSCNCEMRIQDLLRDAVNYASPKNKNKSILQKITTEIQMFDTKIRHFEDCKVDKSKKAVKYTIIEEDDIYMIDEEGDNENHITFEMDDKNIDQRNYKRETVSTTCDCRSKRLDLIAHYLIHNDSHSEQEMETINEQLHYTNCNQFIPYTPGMRYRKASTVTICSHKHCQLILEGILRYDSIKCHKKRIFTFIETKDFIEYQSEFLKVLSSEPSPESMSIFLYVTRTIIRHIDDPRFMINKDIERIFLYSEQYLNNHFLEEIKQYRTLEDYILKYGQVD